MGRLVEFPASQPGLRFKHWRPCAHVADAGREKPEKEKPRVSGAHLNLVPETGVEPATYALRMRRSTN